jgi:hypothetical protein
MRAPSSLLLGFKIWGFVLYGLSVSIWGSTTAFIHYFFMNEILCHSNAFL